MTLPAYPYGGLDYIGEGARSGEGENVRNLIRNRPPSQDLSYYSYLLCDALEHRQYSIINILLSESVPVPPEAMQTAVKSKDYATLTTFLDHGWDINALLDINDTPMLR